MRNNVLKVCVCPYKGTGLVVSAVLRRFGPQDLVMQSRGVELLLYEASLQKEYVLNLNMI